METPGEKIRNVREEKALTQPKLAKLAAVFEVTSDYLLGLEDETGAKLTET